MSASLSPLTVQRLAYVRYLYQEGIEQSHRPTPLSASALLSFHDAVENLLGLVAEHLDAEVKPGTTFLGYWEAIRSKFELPAKANMKRLNDNRVNLKHSGVFPSPQAIEQARETVIDFFTTVVPKVFGRDFDKIDMVSLVTIPEVAQSLRDAQTHADAGDFTTAAAGLYVAFHTLLNHCAGLNSANRSGRSPFAFGARLPPFSPHMPRPVAREAWMAPLLDHKAQIDAIRAAIPELQRAMQVTALGIDYAKYARFQVLAPEVTWYGGGVQRFYATPWQRNLTTHDYNFCLGFVIESALIAEGAVAVLALRAEAVAHQDGKYQEGVWRGPYVADD